MECLRAHQIVGAEFLGYPDFVAEIFTALCAPAGTPSDVVNLLTAEVAALSKRPGSQREAGPVDSRRNQRSGASLNN
jgi:hypothetical protein